MILREDRKVLPDGELLKASTDANHLAALQKSKAYPSFVLQMVSRLAVGGMDKRYVQHVPLCNIQLIN